MDTSFYRTVSFPTCCQLSFTWSREASTKKGDSTYSKYLVDWEPSIGSAIRCWGKYTINREMLESKHSWRRTKCTATTYKMRRRRGRRRLKTKLLMNWSCWSRIWLYWLTRRSQSGCTQHWPQTHNTLFQKMKARNNPYRQETSTSSPLTACLGSSKIHHSTRNTPWQLKHCPKLSTFLEHHWKNTWRASSADYWNFQARISMSWGLSMQ